MRRQGSAWFAALALAAALAGLAGCTKKRLPEAERRAVTEEIVAAAQRAAGRRQPVTIRPHLQADREAVADRVYVTLDDPSRIIGLKQAFAAIARRHNLSFAETPSRGLARFDFAFHGEKTQSVRVVFPLAAPSGLAEAMRHPRLAIIVDDLGEDRAAAEEVLALPFSLTASVLPHLPFSYEIAEEAWRRGDQVMLHLPMEAEVGRGTVEASELRVGMNAAQVESALEGMLATVPHAVGANNHEGSRATADRALMAELMPDLHRHGLFFIDSRTTAATVAYDAAVRAGVPAASRKVFLDDVPDRQSVLAQLNLAARDALRDGSAIAIGHPRPSTISALADGVPTLESRGIRLVFASQMTR